MRKCKKLIEELDNYKFKADESLMSGYTGKPIDKNNHGINALEWITMELPADPKNLLYGVYNKAGVDVSREKEEDERKKAFWALSDEDDSTMLMDETPFDIAYQMWS